MERGGTKTLLAGLNGYHIKKALLLSEELLAREKEVINRINVFPVADADTGTNLYLTVKGIVEEINGYETKHAGEMAERIAEASLLSARGNSGLILSQFLVGFADGVREREVLGIKDLAKGFRLGTEYAYSAVSEPKEGTILTVMRETAEEAERIARKPFSWRTAFKRLLERASSALLKTPELLAKLGKPRVVDSGGYGFVVIVEGWFRSVGGEWEGIEIGGNVVVERERGEGEKYCVNALLETAEDRERIRALVSSLGDSVVVADMNGLVKVHVHSGDPDRVFSLLSGLGEIKWKLVDRIW